MLFSSGRRAQRFRASKSHFVEDLEPRVLLSVAPPAPTSLFADMPADSSITLNWKDNATNESGYLVQRLLGYGGSWSTVATLPSDTQRFVDNSIRPGTRYQYRIVAFNSDGVASSSIVSVSSHTTPPAAPGGLNVTATSFSTATVQWADNSNNELAFQVLREVAGSNQWTVAGTVSMNATSFTDTGLSEQTQYTYQVIAYNGGGRTNSTTAGVTTPAAPVTAPTNLEAAPLTFEDVQLTWTDNATNETGYKVERQTGTGAWTAVATLGANTTSYDDTTVAGGTQYGYRVYAFNDAGNSTNSAPASVSVPQVPAPGAPGSIDAAAATPWQVNLVWTDTARETGFVIQRMTGMGGSWAQIATVGANVTTYSDMTASPSTQYMYRVAATNGGGSSQWVTSQGVTTPSAQAPVAPTLTAASVFSAARVDLTWTDNSTNEQGFIVQESTDGTHFTTVTTQPLAANTASYSVTGLMPSTTYYFRVVSENGAGTGTSLALSAQTKQNVTVDGDGWTTIVPSADSRIIYVSSSMGNDANNGLSADAPVKTLARGVSLLRNGYPDWLLLKRGDTFTTNAAIGSFSMVLSINLSGRSELEPMVVGAYGTGSRPTLDAVIGGRGLSIGSSANYLAAIGLNITSSQRDPSSPNFSSNVGTTEGVFFLAGTAGTTGLLIEDCSVSYCSDDLNLQGLQGVMNDVTIRRDIVTNAYSASGSHSQGLFIANAHNVLLEENIFDHNGWNAQVAGAAATIFNHNIYVQYDCTGSIVVRGNISANASSHGMQIRPGGIVEDNLLVNDPNGILWGNDQQAHPDIAGTVQNNVILNGNDINRTDATGGPAWGIDINNWDNSQTSTVTIEGNIVADKSTTYASSHYLYLNKTNGASFTNNIIYSWPGLVQTSDVNTIMSNNTINGTGYLDPTRTVGSYNSTLGGAATTAAFLQAAEQRGAGTWNSDYSAWDVINYIRAGFGLAPVDAPTSSAAPVAAPLVGGALAVGADSNLDMATSSSGATNQTFFYQLVTVTPLLARAQLPSTALSISPQ